jgi:hypothetical protein
MSYKRQYNKRVISQGTDRYYDDPKPRKLRSGRHVEPTRQHSPMAESVDRPGNMISTIYKNSIWY